MVVVASIEHPIVFSGDMVCAILDGRKTQTRRPVTVRSWDPNKYPSVHVINHGDRRLGTQAYFFSPGSEDGFGVACPYGIVGDRLWVRETWCSGDQYYQDHENDVPGVVGYRADRSAIQFDAQKPCKIPDYDVESWNWDVAKWRPSTSMPRWASRLTLEITGIRVERLQNISEKDALAEGAVPLQMDDGSTLPAFEGNWETEYSKKAPWKSNPWVWVVSFKRI